ncbi:MAG: hypothetical protein R2854_29315 [Caldilineaceae bacterium]
MTRANTDAKARTKKRRKVKTTDDSARAKPTVRVRRWKANDIPGLVACHRAAYPEYLAEDEHYDERNYRFQLTAFPEGQFLAELNGKVIGYATSIIVQLDDSHVYTYAEITGEGALPPTTRRATLYGADIAVDPCARGMGGPRSLPAAAQVDEALQPAAHGRVRPHPRLHQGRGQDERRGIRRPRGQGRLHRPVAQRASQGRLPGQAGDARHSGGRSEPQLLHLPGDD